MSWVIVSYYTKGTGYEVEVKKLQTSLDKFKVPYKLYPKDNLGSWERNCAQKAKVILEALKEFPDKNIVWVDSDATIEDGDLSHFDRIKSDISYYYVELRREVLSGTLFFRNTEKVHYFIERWIEGTEKNPTLWDQKVLQSTLEDMKSHISQETLPLDLVYVFDHRFTEKLDNPKIVHWQASRRLKFSVRK